MWKKLLPIFVAVICLMPMNCRAAEKMSFVDAIGSTGYYVYMDSVAWESDTVVSAKIAVIKAATNRMYVYRMRFDCGMMTYQILSSETLAYDTKTVLESSWVPQMEMGYSSTSIMQEMVSYIMHPET